MINRKSDLRILFCTYGVSAMICCSWCTCLADLDISADREKEWEDLYRISSVTYLGMTKSEGTYSILNFILVNGFVE